MFKNLNTNKIEKSGHKDFNAFILNVKLLLVKTSIMTGCR